jgi:YesN/AraC family two-component response regulator
MIVDDEADMVALVNVGIELTGADLVVVATASSGEDALAKVADVAPDVMLVDYMMPVLNGLELAAKVLEMRPLQQIVLFSAFITDRTEAEARRVGVSQCVLKSRVKELPAILRSYAPVAPDLGEPSTFK